MAEALAIQGARWVASPIITSLLKEGFSSLGVGISTKIQDLETTILPQFQLVIEAAERSTEHKAKFHLWLRKLKDAVYEAEDLLDLYKYQLLEEKVADLNSRPTLKPFMKAATKINAKLSILSPQNIKLRRSLIKLELIAAEAQTFRELLQIPIGNDATVIQNLRDGEQPDVATSFPLHKVFGRMKELDEIVEKYLLDPSEASEPEKNYSVGAIVAIGGAGKTTLAQLVYRDTRVDKHFDIKMWVSISRKLDLAKHTKDMIESSSENECPRLGNLDTIQSKLTDLVKSKKVLLVLDDVWYGKSTNETEREWQKLLAPLSISVKSGSKVLVTTRTKNLPVALRPQYSMALQDLKENHILSLFKLHAFGDTKLDGSDLQEKLMTIGKQIVRKLHGSPLAAKAVGCQLGKTLNVDAWKGALERDNLRDSQQALLWSYQRLDAPLQRCFCYFSLFPKGQKYEADNLVYLWMAEGFINSPNNSKRMEDIGREYFDELISGSFLQKYYTEYYMHDLFHDLAEFFSKEDCLRIEDDQIKEISSPTIRRLSILGRHMRENNMSFNKLENLHTLIIGAGSLSSHAIANLFAAAAKCKKLRVFIVDFVSRETLTKLIPNLKHLRFLSFHWREHNELPAALGKLYHLQVLDSPLRASLPRSLKNLINLRCFVGDDDLFASSPYIGRLTSLQTLSKFVVKKEKGHDIGQLKNLNELRESLTISNLENVEGKDRAVEADLKVKRHLESLRLQWDNNDYDYRRDLDMEMEVLEGLQPHPNLTKLTIEGYKSPKYPSWLPLQNLRSLKLQNCIALEVLPPIDNSFPNCSELEILQLCKLREFPSLPRSLKKIVIRDCPSLIIALEDDDTKKKSELILPSSLQTLELENCNITDGALSQSLQGLTCLKSLWLRNISTITTLPAEEVLHHLTALTHLSICYCPSISSLSEHLPESLKELLLWDCPRILSLPDLPESLTGITIYECPILVERCRSPNGEDWPKITDIPKRNIY